MLLRRLKNLLSYFLIWCSLSGVPDSTWQYIVCVIAILLANQICYREYTSSKISFFGIIYYCCWLAMQILKSTIDVMRLIWSINNKNLQPGFVWIESNQKCSTGTAIYASSITLTPGTVSVNIKDDMILVHALKTSSIDDLQNGDMEKRIAAIFKSE